MSVASYNRSRPSVRPSPFFPLIAQQFLASGRSRQALEICKRGLIYFPENPTGYVVLARTYLELGEQDRALNVIRDGYRRTGAEPLLVLYQSLTGKAEALLPEEAAPADASLDAIATQPEVSLPSPTADLPVPTIADMGSADAHEELSITEQSCDPVDAVTAEGIDTIELGEENMLERDEAIPTLQVDSPGDIEVVTAIVADSDAGVDQPEIIDATDLAPVGDIARVTDEVPPQADLPGTLGSMFEKEREEVPSVPQVQEIGLSLHMGRQMVQLRSSNLRLIPGLEFAPLRQEEQIRQQSIAPLINDEPMPQPVAPSRRRLEGESLEGESLEVRKKDHNAPPLPTFGDEIAEGDRWKIPGIAGEIDAEPFLAEPEIAEELERSSGEKMQVAPNLAYLVREFGSETGQLTPLEELARRLETARIPVVEEAERREVFEPRFVSDTLANILVAQKAYTEAIKAFQTLARMKPDRAEYYQEKIHEMKILLHSSDAPPIPKGE